MTTKKQTSGDSRKAHIGKLLTAVSVLGVSLGMAPAQAADNAATTGRTGAGQSDVSFNYGKVESNQYKESNQLKLDGNQQKCATHMKWDTTQQKCSSQIKMESNYLKWDTNEHKYDSNYLKLDSTQSKHGTTPALNPQPLPPGSKPPPSSGQ
ncbi:MAG: hypothetical protein KGM97_00360 [Alphaproteobacteria bacterium]|nr:hypothetical protein [Alphaproteobacteria bacterium]MDE2629416.1 hypothetical protein [Alphaproteobacteria bacterium]